MDTIQARIQASFGHRTSSRHPAMFPYLKPRQGLSIDLIDPDATQASLGLAQARLGALRAQGAQLLWVGPPASRTSLQALHHRLGEPVLWHRWPGGLLTNFEQVRQSPRGNLPGLHRKPDAVILLSVKQAGLALEEAKRCGIEVIGVIDSNTDPTRVDVPVFGNDDAATCLAYYLAVMNP